MVETPKKSYSGSTDADRDANGSQAGGDGTGRGQLRLGGRDFCGRQQAEGGVSRGAVRDPWYCAKESECITLKGVGRKKHFRNKVSIGEGEPGLYPIDVSLA